MTGVLVDELDAPDELLALNLSGAPFELAFEGTLDEAGTRITGTMHDTAANNRFEFSATKK